MLPGSVAAARTRSLFTLVRSGVTSYSYFKNYVTVTTNSNVPTTNTSSTLITNTAANFTTPLALYTDSAAATFGFTDYYWNIGSGSNIPADYEQYGFFENTATTTALFVAYYAHQFSFTMNVDTVLTAGSLDGTSYRLYLKNYKSKAALAPEFDYYPGPTPDWVSIGQDGNLDYQTTANGDMIMDYSSAGYMGGGVALPVPTSQMITLSPSGGDDTSAIQAAINTIASYPVNTATGFAGVLFFNPGNFTVTSQLNITIGGIVIRGSGSDQTTLWMPSTVSPFTMFNISPASVSYLKGSSVSITNAYVPSGASSFTVSSASALAVGQTICITQSYSSSWIASINSTWSPFSADQQRIITGISGNTLTLDVPVPDSINSTANPGTVAPCSVPNLINQVGLEHFAAGAPFLDTEVSSAQYGLANVDGASNVFFNDIEMIDLSEGLAVQNIVRFMTIQDINIVHTQSINNGAGDPLDISVSGSSILVQNVVGNSPHCHFLTSKDVAMGPIVYLNNTISGDLSTVGPHQHWGAGQLYDNLNSNTEVWFYNQGDDHYWGAAWSTIYNTNATYFSVNMPTPVALNWIVGGQGTYKQRSAYEEPSAIFDTVGYTISPDSLYLQQLYQRLGAQAVTNIGYDVY